MYNIEDLTEQARRSGASDIHLVCGLPPKYRLDGQLENMAEEHLSEKDCDMLCQDLAKDAMYEKLEYTGELDFSREIRGIRCRCHVFKQQGKVSAAIRLLSESIPRLDSLGLPPSALEFTSLHKGIVLVTGETGSGKSTTMCAMLQELANEETNLMTLEDPVEYNIPGVNQCQINEKTGMTFAAGLRAILRQDPDVISVGEIRDGETGAIAIRAAITGHLVLSTLHTNDAVSAIDRLVDIGVEPYLISSALRGVISQRLVRKVCPHCKKAYRPEAEELAMLGLPEDANVQFYRGEGCQECYHTGYKGRRAVFEIFMLNGRIRRMVTEGAKYDALLRAAVETNFVTMRENCRNLVLRGEISAPEAARAINSTAD